MLPPDRVGGGPPIIVFLDVPASILTAHYLASRGFFVLGLTCQRWERRTPADFVPTYHLLCLSESTLADRVELVSGVRDLLAREAPDRPVGAVLSFAEQTVEVAAALREALFVVGTKPVEARRMRDKYVMRRHARGAGILCPDFLLGSQVLDNLAAGVAPLAKDGDPPNGHPRAADLVVKAREGWGCQMIKTFPEGAGLRAWLESTPFAERDRFLVEEFIPGTLLHVAVVVSGRRRHLWAVARHILPLLEVSRRSRPHFALLRLGPEEPLYSDILDLTDACVEAFAGEECFLEVEILRSSATGSLYLCEIAGRPATCGVEGLCTDETGTDLFQMFARMVEARLTGCPPPRQPRQQDGHVGLLVRNGEAGMLVQASDLDFGPPTSLVERTESLYAPGERMRAGGLADNVARLWLRAADPYLCERELRTRLQNLYDAEVL